MKIQLSFKHPDMDSQFMDIVARRIDDDVECGDDVYEAADLFQDFSDKYLTYGEMITIEYDTETKTATVIEQK